MSAGKSTPAARGGKPDSFLPNHYTHLKLLEVHFEGEGKYCRTVEVDLDILGWQVFSTGVLPITLRGPHQPREGCHYAVLNTFDKSHTALDGSSYGSFKEFIAHLFAEHEGRTP